eukprot:scaffold140298_cov115-Phaeocystis_antarctica.AAC.1
MVVVSAKSDADTATATSMGRPSSRKREGGRVARGSPPYPSAGARRNRQPENGDADLRQGHRYHPGKGSRAGAPAYQQLLSYDSKRLDTVQLPTVYQTPGAKGTIVCLVLIWTHPEAELLRSAIRSTQPALTNTTGVIPCGGRELRVICRFALGAPHGAQRQARLFTEQTWHRDLALLNMTEAPGLGRGRSYDGKAWRMLEWAVLNHPEAAVIFKQDADSLVDYRRAVPTFLLMASRVAFQGKRTPKAQHPSR